MIAEVAHGLLWLAAACATLQVFAAWRLPELGGPAALAVGWLWLWIAGGLAWVFLSLDFSVAAVAANTHSALPRALRLAAAVLRPGGGWAVAAALVAWGGAVLAWRGAGRRMVAGLGVAALVLHAVVLIDSNPFMRIDPVVEGAGFAPVWRDRLANFGPVGRPVARTLLAVGAAEDTVKLHAVTPVAGPDSTGVLAEVRVRVGSGHVVLTPEWRETILPRHAASVSDVAWQGVGWWRASLGAPRADARWPVEVTRIDAWPWLLGLALVASALGAVRWRRR